MPVIKGEEGESEAVIQAARLMLISARTAPKAGGEDDISTVLLYGEEKELLVTEMERLGRERGGGFIRGAQNLKNSSGVLLVGVKGRERYRHRIGGKIDCGACGYANCDEFDKAEKKMGKDFVGPICMMKILDLGIALGSVVKMASSLNVDNRVFYTIGVGAVKLKLLPEADIVVGIPLSAKGKNIYFDRAR